MPSRWRSGFLPEPFVAAFPDGRCGGVALDYAIEPEPLDTAGAIRFAADHAGIDDTFVVANGDVLTDLSVADLVGVHRAAERRGDDPPHPGRRPVGVRRRRARRRRPHPGLRREAAAGDRAEQPDQRRHVRVRARASSTASRRAGRCRSSATRSRSSPTAGASTPWRRTTTGSTPGARSCTCGRTSTSSTGAAAEVVQGRRRRRRRRIPTPSSTTASSGAGARVGAGATVTGSVLLPGAVVGAGARRRGLDRRRRVGDGAWVVRSVVGADAMIPDGEHVLDARIPEPGD